MKKINTLVLVVAFVFASGCKKEPEPSPTPTPSVDLHAEILSSFSSNVSQATYNDLADKSNQLLTAIQTFNAATTDVNLTNCKQLWKDTRAAWEQSEGFLFGPVATDNIDPRIDTWPVNYIDLDSVLASSAVFSESYISGLQDALKGFHPIEYLLFGTSGDKTAAEFTVREKDFLLALSVDLKTLTAAVAQSWEPSTTGNYSVKFTTAGETGSAYTTKRAAFEEVVNAMIGICDEVANGKIEEPFVAQDPSLEESPFAFNSIMDFINNIRSVQNVYLGKYTTDGKGIEDLVKSKNLSLDATIKTKINAAIAALNNITVPFGQAIISQPMQVTNAKNAINDLEETLENDLLPFVQINTN
jgi:putative iron-regulated protein